MTKENFKSITKEDLNYFESIFEQEDILTSEDKLQVYGSDETEDLNFPPEVVILARTTEQISKLLHYCSENTIPVTPRGAGTGLSGGAIPRHGGISLSIEKMNKILEIDERNFQVTTEPGVITQILQESVAEKGLFYPPDPASRGSCFIGGNIAENSGGPKAVKYGVTKDYVLNLEVVLPTGEIIWTGANTLKNSTGYNLTQLIVGSEGTLGIVTKIVLNLLPYPKYDMLMLVPFYSGKEACEAVSAIFHAGVRPSGLEFMEKDALAIGYEFLGDHDNKPMPDIEAHLLIEVDGNDQDVLMKDMEAIHGVLENYKVGDILFADSAAQKEKLWKVRRSLGEAVKAKSIYKEEDTVVPRAELPKLLHGVKEIGEKYDFRSVCYGHAGDGNLHVNILREDMDEESWNQTIKTGIREIFELCVSLGGTISGEHGIGLVQREYMDIAFSETELEVQRNIKRSFDPSNILNPGKIF